VELVEIKTQGDVQQTRPVGELGSTGLFTKEIQRSLLDGVIDLAVHSLKDLPTTPVEGLVLVAIPEREEACDVLVSKKWRSLDDLPQGARVGTGSPRRRSQLLRMRPDLDMRGIRGNVDTRLRKLDDGEFDAILLAAAGLKRLGLAERITQRLPVDQVLPAPGQGALGIECRADDTRLIPTLARLNHIDTSACVRAERAMLACVEGGCLAAIGARAVVDQGKLHLAAAVLSFDGRERLFAEQSGEVNDPLELGIQVGKELLSQGAAKFVCERQ